MKEDNAMRRYVPVTATIAVAAFCFSAVAFSQEKSAKDYILEAQTNLHFSCRGIAEKYGENDEAILDVVESMIAVSLINRQIDVPNMQLTEEERTEILSEFVDELGDRCADDADALLAGIVDTVVAEVMQFY